MIQRLAQPQSPMFRDDMVNINFDEFGNNVDVHPFRIAHHLQQHSLFQLDSLMELSQRLPDHLCEYVFAKQEFGSHDSMEQYQHASDNDAQSTDELIRRIEEQNIVVVLRNVETDPVYGKFVNECLDGLSRFVEPHTGPIKGRESYIFISPPNAYTPYHYDPEQNFFMQIRGKKQMAIYDVNDREILPEWALENYYNEGQRITNCDERLFEKHELYELNPGDGVYVPVTAPHWVRTLDEISISISINFRTPSSIRRDRVYRLNRWMRKVGLRPAPVSPRADTKSEQIKSALLGIPARFRNHIK